VKYHGKRNEKEVNLEIVTQMMSMRVMSIEKHLHDRTIKR